MSDAITIQSRAKLNWYLRVGDRRSDGYHDLETVFQELELEDELKFELMPGSDGCEIIGFPGDVAAETNLVTRAWRLLRDQCEGKIPGIRVTAVKNIPRGGGLGGGSSNAAATLVALKELCALNLGVDELQQLGSLLGSDVPFFIRGGCAIGRGKGELLAAIEGTRKFHLVLVFPDQGVSTAEAYRRLDNIGIRQVSVGGMEEVVRALKSGNPEALAGAIFNDFEGAVRQETWFGRCVSALDEAGCLRAFLCGSGSTVAGLARDYDHCCEMFEQLSYILPYTRCLTCTLAGSASSPVGCRDLRRTS